MPLKIYEYLCEKCDERLEHMCNSDEKPESIKCPVCGETAEYVISTGNYHLLNDPDLRKKSLMKRSAEQTEKELKHNYDKFGFKAYGPKKFPGMGEGKVGKKSKKKD